jgi:hypothetical protein
MSDDPNKKKSGCIVSFNTIAMLALLIWLGADAILGRPGTSVQHGPEHPERSRPHPQAADGGR